MLARVEFISKGLFTTTSRDFSRVMNLQSGGIHHYFKSKDEAVVICAEESSFQLENELIVAALGDIYDPEKPIGNLEQCVLKLVLVMKFFCLSRQYREPMRPALDRVSRRYIEYAEQFSSHLGCDMPEVESYVYMCIKAITDYMVFEEPLYVIPQLEMMKDKLIELQNKQKATN